MGLFDIFRSKKGIEGTIGDLPLGMGEEGEEGEGGPHFFRTELGQLRLVAQGAAVEIANSDPDPLMWPDARLVFDAERVNFSVLTDEDGRWTSDASSEVFSRKPLR